MFDPHKIAAALDRLDPETRALLELSGRRGLSDAEIGELLGVDAPEVKRRRAQAVSQVAEDLDARGAERAELRHQLADPRAPHWEPAKGKPAKATAPKSRRPLALAALAALLLIVLVVVIASSGGDDGGSGRSDSTASDNGKAPAAKTTPEGAAPVAASQKVEFERLNGTYGHGTAQLVDGKLRMRVSGFLKPTGGGYAVWLIGPDDKLLYATTDTTIRRDLKLPANYKSFESVEVARAVPSLDSPHTSFSLLRLPVGSLNPGS